MSSGRAGAPSRSQQAFRWLLQGDEDEEGRARGGRGQQPGGKGSGGKDGGRRRGGGSGKGRQPFIPGFKLRCDADAEAAAASGSGSAAGGGELEALQEAFAGVLDTELVADVLASTGGDAAAAMEALLSLAGGGGAEEEGAAAGGGQAARAAPAAEAEAEAEAEGLAAAAGAPAAPCYWDVLPQEIKQLVFEQLSLRWVHSQPRCAVRPAPQGQAHGWGCSPCSGCKRGALASPHWVRPALPRRRDLARAARACREFASYVREQRRSLRTVVVPEGVSYAAVR